MENFYKGVILFSYHGMFEYNANLEIDTIDDHLVWAAKHITAAKAKGIWRIKPKAPALPAPVGKYEDMRP